MALTKDPTHGAVRRRVPRGELQDWPTSSAPPAQDESGIPFERPSEFEGKKIDDVDDAELAELVKERAAAAAQRAAGIGGADTGAGPTHWYENYDAKNSRPWLVDRSGRRTNSAAHAGAQARIAAMPPARSSFTGGPWDESRGPQPLRSLHHARAPRIDDAGDLRQLVPDRAGPGLRRDPLRDDPRDAHHPARRPPASHAEDPQRDGRRPRPLGRQHAGRRDHQFQSAIHVSQCRQRHAAS